MAGAGIFGGALPCDWEWAHERDVSGKQTASRRTFAIISHPDAGKTILAERLL